MMEGKIVGNQEGVVTCLSMVTSITLFVVLDRLGVADAAGRCSRRGAGGLFCDFVAAAISVYDLGAHVGVEAEAACEAWVARRWWWGASEAPAVGSVGADAAGVRREGGVGAWTR